MSNFSEGKWQHRIAPSLGALEDTPENIWETLSYTDKTQPVVFFGLYGFPDFYELWRHKGRKAILWAGSDILHFVNGYWLDERGSIKLSPKPIATWINKYCESYVENTVEQELLRSVGIESIVVPSFLGKVSNYELTYVNQKRPKVYLSCSGDNFKMYGWDVIEKIADKCDVDFYLYGSDKWRSQHKNVFVRGRIPKEQMNQEIKEMQCGLRLNTFDGFSEILAKSILWGQHPISMIKYPEIKCAEGENHLIYLLNSLKDELEPNIDARNHYLQILNNYPWYENNK